MYIIYAHRENHKCRLPMYTVVALKIDTLLTLKLQLNLRIIIISAFDLGQYSSDFVNYLFAYYHFELIFK